MIVSINLSQETFAIDKLTALKASLEQSHKHVLRLLLQRWISVLHEDGTMSVPKGG